jgi:transposase
MVFIASSKNQTWLFPPNIKDLIPKDHICFLVDSFVEELDFTEFENRYEGAGHPAYHPRIMCKILIQSMLDRVRSSRAIARNVRENVVYIYLAEKLTPDFRTISDFRKNNNDLLKQTFKQSIAVARELGMVGLEQISIDGTILKASASNNSAVTEKELAVISEYIDEELKKAIDIDKEEDERFKDLRGYDQLNTTETKKVKHVIQKYTKQTKKDPARFGEIRAIVENAKEELKGDTTKKISLTDTECRFMKNKKGRIEFSYNSQIIVDHKKGIILVNDVCKSRSDYKQLIPQIENLQDNCGVLEKGMTVCADRGYYSMKNVAFIHQKKLEPYIPPQINQELSENKDGISSFDIGCFKYNAIKDEYICPEGKILRYSYKIYDEKREKGHRVYTGTQCKECGSNSVCTQRKDKIRRLKKLITNAEHDQFLEKMKTDKAKEMSKLRKQNVEPVIGNYKQNLGFREYLTRGINTVKNEFNLVCTAVNLKKIYLFCAKVKV